MQVFYSLHSLIPVTLTPPPPTPPFSLLLLNTPCCLLIGLSVCVFDFGLIKFMAVLEVWIICGGMAPVVLANLFVFVEVIRESFLQRSLGGCWTFCHNNLNCRVW